MNVESIRGDFPILQRTVNGKPLVYLDSGATAQKPERVIEAVNRLHREQNNESEIIEITERIIAVKRRRAEDED